MTDIVWHTLRYVEARLGQPLRLADLAEHAGYSPYHFARAFAAEGGMSPMAYVRMRRLQHASAALRAGERVLDVALRFGFDSHEGFTRAFRRYYGIPPVLCRQHGLTHVPTLEQVYRTMKQGGFPMEYRIEQRPDTPMVGYRHHTTPGSAEIPGYWAALMTEGNRDWQRLMAVCDDGTSYGVCIMTQEMMDAGTMDYFIGVNHPAGAPVPEGLTGYVVPAATYAIFPVPAGDEPFPQRIKATWTHIFSEWFPASDYEHDTLEAETERYGPTVETCAIYIPVRRKARG